MGLSARDAFKVGFLARCAADGLSSAQITERVKLAFDLPGLSTLNTVIGKTMDAGQGLGNFAVGWGAPAAALAPVAVGGMAGYGLAKATDIDDTDVADIKDQEVLNEYRRQTQHLLRQRAARDYAAQRKRTGRMFG